MSHSFEQQNLSDSSSLLESTASTLQDSLQNFAKLPGFDEQIILAFGDEINVDRLQTDWQTGNFTFPAIEIVSASTINNANGAFSGDTNTIYISAEFLAANQSDLNAVNVVLLEEYGHYLDSELNLVDSPGDEGAIFSALVLGEELTDNELQQLRSEDDSAVVNIDGETIAIEASNANLDSFVEGLDSFFDTLQNALNSEVFGSDIPLFGDTLEDYGAASTQFIENLREQTVNELRDLETLTPEIIRDTLNNSLSGIGSVEIVSNSAGDCRFRLSIGESGTDNVSLDTDLGFDGLGVNANDDGQQFSF